MRRNYAYESAVATFGFSGHRALASFLLAICLARRWSPGENDAGRRSLLCPADDFAFRQLIEARADDMRCVRAKAVLEFAGLLVRARSESAIVLLDLLDRSCLAWTDRRTSIAKPALAERVRRRARPAHLHAGGPRELEASGLQHRADPLVIQHV